MGGGGGGGGGEGEQGSRGDSPFFPKTKYAYSLHSFHGLLACHLHFLRGALTWYLKGNNRFLFNDTASSLLFDSLNSPLVHLPRQELLQTEPPFPISGGQTPQKMETQAI